MGRFPSITHPFAARRQDCSRVTARLACVKHAASVQSEPGSNSSLKFQQYLEHQVMNDSKAQLTLLDFWSLGQLHPKDLSTRVPTQVTCQIFKEPPRRKGRSEARPLRAAERAGKYSPAAIPVNISSQRGSVKVPLVRELRWA